jgi:hypothetical protein
LDEKNLGILIRSLTREANGNKKPEIAWPDIDVVICHLDDAGALAHCSTREGAARASSDLKKRGISYNLSPDSYRKRLERLRRKGVELESDKY